MDALMDRELLDCPRINSDVPVPASLHETNYFPEEFGEEVPLDIYKENCDLVISASLPGFKKEEIEVGMQHGILSIKAEHIKETETKNKSYYYRERKMGPLRRQVILPTMVAPDRARGELKEGVLTLRIPLAEEGETRQIDINWAQK